MEQQNFETSLTELIFVRSGAPPDAALIVISTDSFGTPGMLNGQILRELGLNEREMPSQEALANGYHIRSENGFLVCFVVTIGAKALTTDKTLQANLTRALQDPMLDSIGSIWLPLMGTGTGGLSFDKSFTITVNALRTAGFAGPSSTRIIISLPPEVMPDEDPKLIKAIEAARRAIRKDSDAEQAEAASQWGPEELSPAVTALLALASGLKTLRKQSGGQLSTSLLLFALAEARFAGVSDALAGDRSTIFIATAIHDRAGKRYDNAWGQYFAGPRSADPIPSTIRTPKLTANAQIVFRAARERARQAGRAVVETDDVIECLLALVEGRFNLTVEALGTSRDELLEDYRDMRAGEILMSLHNDVATVTDKLGYGSYADAIARFLVDTDTPPPLSISIQAPWGAGKSSLMQLIREKLDPKEQRERYKRRLGESLTARLTLDGVIRFLNRSAAVDEWSFFGFRTATMPVETAPPKVALATAGQRLTIWFNAWKYETSEQIWAGLVDAIVTQVSERLPPVERETFLLRLQLSRIDDGIVRKKIYDRVFNLWWATVRRWALLGGTAILSLLGLAVAPHAVATIIPADYIAAGASLQAFGLIGALFAQVMLSVYLVRKYFVSVVKTKAEPATFALADYIRVPDYGVAVGQIHNIHSDLRRVLGVTPSSRKGSEGGVDGEQDPIVIFIDDLDRCSPGKIASVVEGVSMLLASDTYRCMFVIGMDPQMVAAALEKAHEDVRDELPSYERTVPLGWRFMDKFVQLPFTIPPSRKDQLDTYLESLGGGRPPSRSLATLAVESVPPASVEADSDATDVDAADQIVAGTGSTETESVRTAPIDVPVALPNKEARDVGKIIRLVASHTAGNPREVKRMVNLARLYLHLRNARRKDDPAWRSPALDQYARWIALTLRWPDMMRWLQWGVDEASWQSDDVDQDLIIRRLNALEASAAKADTAKTWRDTLGAQLHLTDAAKIEWTGDPKLFEFFQAEARMDKGDRVSAAAHLEFW